jgi:hypothetical protein
MDMGKKLNQMGSDILNKGVLLYLFLLGCSPNKISDKQNITDSIGNKEVNENKVVNNVKINFTPDTVINNRFFLSNSELFDFPIKNIHLTEGLRESPVYIFFNKRKDEYLLLYHYEGSAINTFDCFEIGYAKDLGSQNGVVLEGYDSFITGSGMKIGIQIDSLINIKGSNYVKKTNANVYYEISDYAINDFLQRYNMPAYFIDCSINGQIVSKVKFGFIQP